MIRIVFALLAALLLQGCVASFQPKDGFYNSQIGAWGAYYATQHPRLTVIGYTCTTPMDPDKCKIELYDPPVAPQIAQGRGAVEALGVVMDGVKALATPVALAYTAARVMDQQFGDTTINANGSVEYTRDANLLSQQSGDGSYFDEFSWGGRSDYTHEPTVVTTEVAIPLEPAVVRPDVVTPTIVNPVHMPTQVIETQVPMTPAWPPGYTYP